MLLFGNAPVNTMLCRYLDTAGDGSGTKNANGNYSAAEEVFYIQPPASTIYRIARMIVSAEDASTMQAQEYGNLGAALGTGIEVRVQNDSGTVIDLTDSATVQTNAHWGRLCYDADVKSWGAGNELLVVRWTFAKSGVPLRLDGDANERLEVVLNDDLRGLISHYFLVQGYTEDTATRACYCRSAA